MASHDELQRQVKIRLSETYAADVNLLRLLLKRGMTIEGILASAEMREFQRCLVAMDNWCAAGGQASDVEVRPVFDAAALSAFQSALRRHNAEH